MQLPPIAVAAEDDKPDKAATKWLGRDIFVAGKVLRDPGEELSDCVVQLDTQHRMHPHISAIPNELVYGGSLRDGAGTSDDTSSGSDVSGRGRDPGRAGHCGRRRAARCCASAARLVHVPCGLAGDPPKLGAIRWSRASPRQCHSCSHTLVHARASAYNKTLMHALNDVAVMH